MSDQEPIAEFARGLQRARCAPGASRSEVVSVLAESEMFWLSTVRARRAAARHAAAGRSGSTASLHFCTGDRRAEVEEPGGRRPAAS